ncbi:MAG TPA: hypothetical protein VFG95_00645 [Nitrospiria bacterium]|nr:hypothetical protein [Nitrospiria bacterium]
MRKSGAGGLLIFTLMVLMFKPAGAADTFNTSATLSLKGNDPAGRGFDPGLIIGHGPSDPFPDTSTPNPNLNTVPPQTGSSTRTIDQSIGGDLSQGTVIQTTDSSINSTTGTLSARAHHIQTSFQQQENDHGQVFNLAFSIDAMTDADGNPVNVLTSGDGRPVSATGTFTQTVKDPITTAGATVTCSGTFTFDGTNGYVLESGPAGQCK